MSHCSLRFRPINYCFSPGRTSLRIVLIIIYFDSAIRAVAWPSGNNVQEFIGLLKSNFFFSYSQTHSCSPGFVVLFPTYPSPPPPPKKGDIYTVRCTCTHLRSGVRDCCCSGWKRNGVVCNLLASSFEISRARKNYKKYCYVKGYFYEYFYFFFFITMHE